jgi:Zn-dependent membrane protease YugP
MHFVILIILLLALVFGPQAWARHVLARHSRSEPHIPGTGGELARHLAEQLHLDQVRVEITDKGDHYDPESRTVRLSADNYHGKSLTAISVAAHEIGHAVQHQLDYAPLQLRSRLVPMTVNIQRLGSLAMLAMPVVAIAARAPSAGLVMLVAGLATLGSAALVHLITLPVEWDASFNRALPILKAGNYIRPQDEPAVRRILKACALTYVAASLASLLNLGRWIALLLRR